MCGLVGALGYLGKNESKMFRDMLIFDQLRGLDSTGIAFVDIFDKVEVEKAVGCPSNLWEHDKPSNLDYKGIPSKAFNILLGHNRAATMGAVDLDGAHPFTFDHITGAHNGTLWDWDDLEGAKTLAIDSQAIFNTISKKGLQHTWKNFSGAAALTYYDSKQRTMNFVRNRERPLYFATDSMGECLFWASELWMISVAASKNGIKLKKCSFGKEEKGEIISLPVDTHFSVEVTDKGFKKVGYNTLEKKFSLLKKSYMGFKTSNGGKATQINTKWAEDTVRAPKSHVGKTIKLGFRKDFNSPKTNTALSCYVMFDSKGNQVKVFPDSIDVQRRFATARHSGYTNYYTLKARPRRDKEGVLCISSSQVDFSYREYEKETAKVNSESVKK